MLVLSKLFLSPYNELQCNDFLHHNGFTCLGIFFHNCFRGTISSSRYFLPLAISPIVLKANQLNLLLLRDILRYYSTSVLWAAAAGSLSLAMICFLRKILGKFYYYSSALIPSYMAFQLVWFLPVRNLRLFGIGTTQATLETLLYQHKNRWTRLITGSWLSQTLLFMLSSAIIMHFKRCRDYNGFWFLQPVQPIATATQAKDKNSVESKAQHKVHPGMSCENFVLAGMKSCFMYGLPLDLLNVLIKGKLPKNIADIAIKLRKMRFTMTAFFISSAGIYRLSLCMLRRHSLGSASDVLEHAFSAFLSGASYIFLGKLTIAVYAVVLAIQAIWQHFCRKDYDAKQEPLLVWLQQIPFFRLLLPLNLAFLIHSYIFCNDSVSKLGKGFLIAATDGRIERIYQWLLRHVANLP